MNENQNLTIKVKLSTNMEGNTLGVATLFVNTPIGNIKISGFRIIKTTYSTGMSLENVDVMPPSFRNRYGKYSPIFFFEPNNQELSKEKWLKFKQRVLGEYQKERDKQPEEIDLDDIPDDLGSSDASNL